MFAFFMPFFPPSSIGMTKIAPFLHELSCLTQIGLHSFYSSMPSSLADAAAHLRSDLPALFVSCASLLIIVVNLLHFLVHPF